MPAHRRAAGATPLTRAVLLTAATLLGSGLVAAGPATAATGPEVDRRPDGILTYSDPGLAGEPTDTVRGELRTIETHEHGTEHGAAADGDEHIIVTGSGEVVPVDIDVETSAPARITAELVDPMSPDEPADVATATVRPITTAAVTSPVALRARVVVVTNSGPVGTDAEIERRVDAGLAYWRAEGGPMVTGATRIGGVVRYASSLADPCGFRDVGSMFREAGQQVPSLASGDHLVIVVSDDCNGVGVADVGSSLRSSGRVLMADSPSIFTQTFAHEVGHNLSLNHANLRCSGCAAGQDKEYWDLFSIMGLAVGGSTFGPTALDSAYRDQLGLVESGEIETFAPAAGERRTVELSARGSAAGRRGLEVRLGRESTWVELRDGMGRDASSFYARSRSQMSGRTYAPGIALSRRDTGSRGSLALLEAPSSRAAWAAGTTYTSGDLSISVDAVKGSSATVTVGRAGPAPTLVAGAPVLTGTPQVGTPFAVDPGAWTSGSVLTYAWLRDGQRVTGATSATYTPTADDVGRRLSVVVTGSRTGWIAASATSGSSEPVAPATPEPTTAPPTTAPPTAAPPTAAPPTAAPPTSVPPTAAPPVQLSGSVRLTSVPRVGATVRSVTSGFPADATLHHQWLVDGRAVRGATGSTYRPTSSQWRRVLTVVVSATRGADLPGRAVSAPVRVGSGTMRTTRPRISGSAQVGRTLRAHAGAWSPSASFSYRWLADGRTVARATRPTMRLTKALHGRRVAVIVTGSSPGYATTARSSHHTRTVRR